MEKTFFFIIFFILLTISANSAGYVSTFTSDAKRFNTKLAHWDDRGIPIFVAGCIQGPNKTLLVVPKSEDDGVFVLVARDSVEYTAPITFSTKSKEPFIEGTGIASSKSLYRLYRRSFFGKPLILLTSYDYDLLIRKLKFGDCKNSGQ